MKWVDTVRPSEQRKSATHPVSGSDTGNRYLVGVRQYAIDRSTANDQPPAISVAPRPSALSFSTWA